MWGLVILVWLASAGYLDAQTLSTSPIDAYTALVPVNIRCKTDPHKGLSCYAEYPDQCKEQWNFPNPCTPQNLHQNVTKFIHPFDTTKFLMCGDMGKLYVVQCPQYEVFNERCAQCVGEGSGFDASCEVPLTPMIKNPCTRERILANNLYFPFPGDLGKFIHCDIWGKAWQRACTADQVWSQYDIACVSPAVFSPCGRATTDVNYFYNHPCDPYRYLRCDMSGSAYEVICPPSTVFSEAAQVCQPLSTISYQPENICRLYKFSFRLYTDVSGQQAPYAVAGAAPRVIVGQATSQVGANNVGGVVRNEFKAIMDAWSNNVNGGSAGRMAGSGEMAMARSAGGMIGSDGMGIGGSAGGMIGSGGMGIGGAAGGMIGSGGMEMGGAAGGMAGSGGMGIGGAAGGMTGSGGMGIGGAAGGMTGSAGMATGGGTTLFATGANALNSERLALAGSRSMTVSGPGKNIDIVGGNIATDIHPSLLASYEFTNIPWSEPCTPENVNNARYHFKLRGDPHFYIQCDAHGNMFKKPCPKSGRLPDWFDAYTSTCVDGPVHLPSETFGSMNEVRPGSSMVHTGSLMMNSGVGGSASVFNANTPL